MIRQQALEAFLCCDVDAKLKAVDALSESVPPDVPARPHCGVGLLLPGRPDRPVRVPPQEVPRRAAGGQRAKAALLHALAHIEFNAINLALDAAWRFDDMPAPYYSDWIRVARDEARHFQLLRTHLRSMGHDYGDFPAHDGLWDMAERTAQDVLARLALVPRVLEARGLDACPPMRDKLAAAGDMAAAAILDVILHDEITHVAIGNHWFRWLCQQRGLDELACFEDLKQRYRAPRIQGPFNYEARRLAGFSDAELRAL